MKKNLYIIHGVGNDSVGLIGKITVPVADAGGNIVDLRQDVMHGLFIISIVVDLSPAEITIENLQKLCEGIAEETGLRITVDKYYPVPRNPEIKTMLLILLGKDRPGIIATVTGLLSKYNINIEFSTMIARAGVFLMDLMVDVEDSKIPTQNLKERLSEAMNEVGISAMFQTENVFNKEKRLIIFDISSSLMSGEFIREIAKNSEIDEKIIADNYTLNDIPESLRTSAGYLEGLPADVLKSIAKAVTVTPETSELIQTLKIMGYRIGLVTTGFSVFAEEMKQLLDIDYSFGCSLTIDDDSKLITGEIDTDPLTGVDTGKIVDRIVTEEKIDRQNIAIIDDNSVGDTPGILLNFSGSVILDLYNKRVLSKDNLLGLIGSFGIPGL